MHKHWHFKYKSQEKNIFKQVLTEVYEKLPCQKLANNKQAYWQCCLQSLQYYLSHQIIMKLQKQVDQAKLFKDSKIIDNYQEQEDIFISECLNNPKQVKLLFRASQHQFLAHKFHKLCDGIPNLLVLVKTNFGKIIGGFNSIGWKSQLEGWTTDNQSNCFIFSVSLMQKMDLIQPHYAFENSGQTGPIFGEDIQLSDKCNQDQSCYSYFSSCYNFKYKPYTQGSQTWRQFSGSSTNKFSVIEYEVFQVIL